MKPYRVDGGVARLGPGQLLGLDKDQIRRRAHCVEIVEQVGDGGAAVVRALGPVEFKVGEIIALPDLPRNLVDIIVPLEGPANELERQAVDRAEQRREAAEEPHPHRKKKHR